jgi:FKBP-type peptidyl-prolyl cis-trans isomerase FkpA
MWRAATILVLGLALAGGTAFAQEKEKPKRPDPFPPGPQKAFLVENAKLPGWVVTPSGLQYHVLQPGRIDKAPPNAYDVVRVHYQGRLLNGKVFDSTNGQQPATFPLHSLIPGWMEALGTMRIGEKRELAIPAELGYGAKGTSDIPGNATLLFEVELVGIVQDRF